MRFISALCLRWRWVIFIFIFRWRWWRSCERETERSRLQRQNAQWPESALHPWWFRSAIGNEWKTVYGRLAKQFPLSVTPPCCPAGDIDIIWRILMAFFSAHGWAESTAWNMIMLRCHSIVASYSSANSKILLKGSATPGGFARSSFLWCLITGKKERSDSQMSARTDRVTQ